MKDTITVTIIDRAGQEHHIEAPTDMNLNMMEICRMNDLGVEGTCGGMALCASCQVYLESDHQLHEQSDAELDMLDQAFFVKSNSRLGCQIKITGDIEGLVVRVAPKHDD
ncbi:MAG: ferredoxin [Bacteroidetes bacterium]|nr:ferredoxin [Bacteroidota bacterium]